MAELNEFIINGSNYTFEDDVARELAAAEETRARGVEQTLQLAIDTINGKIPTQATSQNQLADKEFVNSSISTATADFKGTYNSLEDLEQVTANANDYAFVIVTDAAGNTLYKRYKWAEGTGWTWEYDLNNSSFTAAQWAAIQSGITAALVTKLSELPDNSTLNQRITQAIASALTDYYTKSEIDTALGNKQDAIQDLADIRSGASAGATAVQPETLNSELSDTVAESGVYDVTANNDNAKFASLSALLSSENLDTLIPSAKRRGGMSIKFVRSSDNKYVQYRLMSDSFNTTPANWQGVDDEPTAGSNNLVKSGGVAERLGIYAEDSIAGNGSDWANKSYTGIIKAGELIKIKVTGPITFAGTSSEQLFLTVALVKAGMSPTYSNYIKLFYEITGATAFTNKEVFYTPEQDCYLRIEGRWHTDENLNVSLYKNLFLQVENNTSDINSLQNQVSALPTSIKAEQDKISRGTARVITCSQISFDNTTRKVSIATVIIADPSSTNSRLLIPAAEIDYNFNISATNRYCLAYNIEDEEYKFISTGNASVNDIVIACLQIQGNNPTSTVVIIEWCSIYNCLFNGVYYGLHNVRGTVRVVHSTGIAFDNSTRKITINKAIVTNTNEDAGRLTIPATEVPYDFNISLTSEWWLVYNITSQEYKFISAGYDTFADIVFAGFKIQGDNPNSIITKLLWCAIQNCSLNGVSIQTQITDNKEAIQEAQQDIDLVESNLNISSANITIQNIKVGSIWDGNISNSNTCLIADAAIKVIPNTKINCIHANDIKIRITELNSSKGFIKQKGYEKFENLVLSGNTHYIIIAADYSERGYSQENPITVAVYNEGDFGVELTDSRRIEAVENFCNPLIDDFEDKFYFVDGSTWKNGGYKYNVRIIPVVGGGTIFCKANPSISTRIAFLNSFDEESIVANLPIAVDGTGNQNTSAGQTRTYNIPLSCNYIAISSFYGGYALPDTLIINGIDYTYDIKNVVLEGFNRLSDIIGRNIQKDAAVRATGINAVNSDIKPFSFLHISDIHTKGDNYKCFENACEFLQHYSNIKCMIATGDLVWDTYHDPTTWYDLALAKTSKPVLNVIGNHDAGQYNATYGLGSQSSDLECYNKFIAPYVNAGTLSNGVTVPGWGVVQPSNAATEGKSYYYKDFSDEKVRLIVLNEFETDYEVNQEGTGLVYNRETRAMRQAQVTWLIDTLTNTPSDYGVIVSYHQPDALASEDNEFVSFDLTAEYRATHGAASTIAHVYCDDTQWLPKILNAFATKSSLTLTVTQTGAVVTSSPTLVCDCDFTNVQAEFICILNGHTHRDYIGHHFSYPALTVLCVGADNLLYTSTFQPRQTGTPSEDLFNVVNIDRNRKTIKIIRIGSDASVTGQVRDQMIMSYATT